MIFNEYGFLTVHFIFPVAHPSVHSSIYSSIHPFSKYWMIQFQIIGKVWGASWPLNLRVYKDESLKSLSTLNRALLQPSGTWLLSSPAMDSDSDSGLVCSQAFTKTLADTTKSFAQTTSKTVAVIESFVNNITTHGQTIVIDMKTQGLGSQDQSQALEQTNLVTVCNTLSLGSSKSYSSVPLEKRISGKKYSEVPCKSNFKNTDDNLIRINVFDNNKKLDEISERKDKRHVSKSWILKALVILFSFLFHLICFFRIIFHI